MKTMRLPVRFLSLFLVSSLFLTACQGLRLAQVSPVPVLTASGQLPETGGSPYVKLKDQSIINGAVQVDEVFSNGPGWLVIYDDHGGKVGDFIGWMPVNQGLNRNFTVSVNTGHMSKKLYAVLHTDAGYVGVPEFPSKEAPDGPDVAVKVNGQVVLATFQDLAAVAQATQPVGTPGAGTQGSATPEHGMEGHQPVGTSAAGGTPSIHVADQDVQGGMVSVAEAVSAGPGWAVIYTEGSDGQPGEQLGYAPLVDGQNTNVMVAIDPAKATPRLFAVLHQDTGAIGTFEYPQADPPVHIEVRMVQASFRADVQVSAQGTPAGPATPEASGMPGMEPGPGAEPTGPTVVTDDQPIRGGTVIIDEVYSTGPGWIGVHLSNPDGTLSHAAIGAGRVNPGLNHNVIVHLTKPERATPVMYAMLHVDSGTVGEYEFPDPAIDVPVLEHGMEVMDVFTVTMGLAGQAVLVNAADGGGTPYLADAQGFSLYVQSSGDCTSRDCQANWLPLLVTGKLTAGDGVTAAKLGVVSLGDGRKQVTYGNLPLYYYAGDAHPGEINGQGVDGVWFLARP